MNLKEYYQLPEIVPIEKIYQLISELSTLKVDRSSEELLEILCELGERFSKYYKAPEEELKEEIWNLISHRVDFDSLQIIEMTTSLMFLFKLENCFDYLTAEVKIRSLKAAINAEITEALKEYKASFL